MKTTLCLLLATIFLLAVVPAQAEVCYQLKPFPDLLRVSLQIDAGSTNVQHELVYGNWVTSFYTLPIVGALELNAGSATVRRLGIHGTNDTSFFGANPACVLDGVPGGAWSLSCFGGGSGRFHNSGTDLAPTPCSALPPVDAGPVAGGG